ncbi:WD repeat-containing protein 18-like [Limulus polyphemus]|uniref:WD repeat-containing protein 18-like n=1 Tax=Limulus polyphemus TaxID=6850 RepID=A0ABM1B7X0_LIMPO|nr:WD repeat-containing protein 18-like [Limulus polyphemus]
MSSVVITSDENGQLCSSCVWDVDTGATLASYKGATCATRTLNMIGNEFLIGAQKDKPLLHVWALHKKEQFQLRMVCPGQVSALVVSPDATYCVAGIGDKLYLWQISTGNLLVVLSRHYQNVTCVRFTDDGSHFLSAGEDGLVLVWALSRVLINDETIIGGGQSRIEPRYFWSNHAMSVTDVHVGCGGIQARVATCSLDQTCKLYDLASGNLLVSVVMDVCLTSVTMDPAEYHLFLGSSGGNVYQLNLYKSVERDLHYSTKAKESLTFIGHSKQVTCLDVSSDGLTLLSGSRDQNVTLWHIPSRQCIRKLPHKGAVTNAFFSQTPYALFQEDTVRKLTPLQTFKKHLFSEEDLVNEEENGKNGVHINLHHHPVLQVKELSQEDKVSLKSLENADSRISAQSNEELKEEVEQLKSVNHQLYLYSVTSLLKSNIADYDT